MLLKCHIGFRGEAHSSSCRQAEGQEGPCCCKRDDDVDLRRLRQTTRLAHWSVCPSQVAPMMRGSVDLDDSVHRVCVCVPLCFDPVFHFDCVGRCFSSYRHSVFYTSRLMHSSRPGRLLCSATVTYLVPHFNDFYQVNLTQYLRDRSSPNFQHW